LFSRGNILNPMRSVKKDPWNCKFGAKLEALRRAKGLTREDMAEKIEVSSIYYSYIEQGRRGVSVPGLLKIAKVLGVKPSQLLDDL
jgi:transcriptional regulator with XRE-family HTH domain